MDNVLKNRRRIKVKESNPKEPTDVINVGY